MAPTNQFWSMRNIEPKRKFRWIATIGNDQKLFSYVVTKVTKPEWTTAPKEHKILGHTFNYPGPVTWNQVELTFLDIAEADANRGNAALFLQDVIYASGYVPPTNINNAAAAGVTKARATSAFGRLNIEQLNADGIVLEKYTFNNPWIEKISFGGELDYSTDDFLDLTLTVRYDWAQIEKGDSILPPTGKTKELLNSPGLSNANVPWGHTVDNKGKISKN